jgi:hypothetical protein
MALLATIAYVDATGPVIRVGFKLAASGNYPSGGDTVNLAAATQDPSFVGMVPQIEALGAPLCIDIWDQSGVAYQYQFNAIVGTAQSNGKMWMSASASFGTQFTPGAYPAAVTGATLVGEAVFAKL